MFSLIPRASVHMKLAPRSVILVSIAFGGTACGLPPGCLPGYQPAVHTASHELRIDDRRVVLRARTFSYFVSGGRGAWGHRVYGFETRLRLDERPSFVVETTTVGENLSSTALLDRLRRFEVRLTPDGTRAQVRGTNGATRRFHFISEGPGFDLDGGGPNSGPDERESVRSFVLSRLPRERLCDAERSTDLWRAIGSSKDAELSSRLWSECDGPASERYVEECKRQIGQHAACQEASRLMLGLSVGRPALRQDIMNIVAATCDEYSCHLVAELMPFATAEEERTMERACASCVLRARGDR